MRLLPLVLLPLLACGHFRDQKTQAESGPGVYPASQTRGQVKVTLLELGRVTTFQPSGNLPAAIIPGLRVVYLVECLGPEPIRNWVVKEATPPLFAQGRSLQPSLPAGVPPGSIKQTIPFRDYRADRSTLPMPEDPERAAIYEFFFRGRLAPAGPVALHLTAGFNDRSDDFIFQDLQL